MIPIKSIKLIENSIIIDFSQRIRLSIFINFRYNQVIFSIVIECYRLSILSIAHVGTVTSLHSKNVLQLSYWKSSVRGTSRHIVYFSYKKRWHSASPGRVVLGLPSPSPQSLYGRTDGRTYADVRTKIFRINGLPNLLTHGAPRVPLIYLSLPYVWIANIVSYFYLLIQYLFSLL